MHSSPFTVIVCASPFKSNVTGVIQAIAAAHPGPLFPLLEVNSKVKQPDVETTVPGVVVPVNVPINVEAVVEPS